MAANAAEKRQQSGACATKDAMQQAVRDALIAFMAATTQAQAEATKAAQRARIEALRGCRHGTHRQGDWADPADGLSHQR
jgi:hypothetical protein